MANTIANLIQAKETARPQGQAYGVGQYLELDRIRMDGGTQARAGLDNATLNDYAETWQTLSSRQNGFLEMPPIVVYHDGTDYWLADGFHRVVAYQQFLNGGSASASPRAIRAVVQQGTQRDAILFACGANDTHGLRRTQADKRRAIERVLSDPEWRQWSDSEIARRCNVSHPTVATVRRELYPENLQDSRTVERNGTTYQQKPPARPAEPTIPIPPDDLRKAGVGLTRHGSWWVAVGYSGEMNNWTSGNAQPWDLAVAAAREEIARRVAREIETVTNVTLSNEGQARAAAKVAPEDRPEVLVRAVAIAGDQPLAARHITQAASEVVAPGWVCESCGNRITDMRKPMNPICTQCAITRDIERHRSARVQPSISEDAPDLPIDFSVVQRRLAAHGVTLTSKGDAFVLLDRGGAESRVRKWDQVLDRLEHLEDAPNPDPSAPAFRMTCPTCGEVLMNGVWGDLKECGSCYHAHQRSAADPAHVAAVEEQIEAGDREPQLMPTLIELDTNRMPDDLHRAGYYWQSADPFTIALNGSDRQWSGQTPEQAIEVARTHHDSKGEPLIVFPALTPLECKALLREAKMFIASGLDKKLPTIGQALRIAARMALEATE